MHFLIRHAASIATALFVFTLLSTGLSTAQGVRAPAVQKNPLNEKFRITFGGVPLAIPAGYLAPWPRTLPDDKERVSKSLWFNFWMPTKRYVELDDIQIVGGRPKEPGRTISPDEYVVRIIDLQILSEDALEAQHRSPLAHYRNYTMTPSPEAYTDTLDASGLINFWRNDTKDSERHKGINYRTAPGEDAQINLSCNPYGGNRCIGYVYIRSEQFSFRIWIPRDKLSEWRQIIESTKGLIAQWRRDAAN